MAAYFAPTDPKRETVDALDVTSGIAVLHIDRSDAPRRMRTPRKPASEQDLSITANVGFVPNERWGYVCQLPSAELGSAVPGVTGQN